MKKIAFIGSDSTHTEAYGFLINSTESPLPEKYRKEYRVTNIWGHNYGQTKEKARMLGISSLASTLDEALEGVDCVMVLSRYGEDHFEPTKMCLERGLPTFVDKPFTTSGKEAGQLARIAEETKTPLMSASPLRFCSELSPFRGKEKPEKLRHLALAAPAHCIDIDHDPRLDSCFFYGIHALEMIHQILGDRPKKTIISADSHGVIAQFDYGSAGATLQLIRGVEEFYSINGGTRHESMQINVKLDGSYYNETAQFILGKFFQGEDTIPLTQTLSIIETLQAMDEELHKNLLQGTEHG